MTARPALARSLAALLLLGPPAAAYAAPERLTVFYGADAAPEQFARASTAVLDSDRHPPLGALRARGVQLFGYISLGEAEPGRALEPPPAVLLGPNPDWPGARYVDLRHPQWRAHILDRAVPRILAQGFDGLFLDTLDDAGTLEYADPVRNRSMVAAAADLVRAIHARYPEAKLMLNRAYDVAALVPDALDAILAESLTTTYDFKTRRYHRRPKPDRDWGLARVAEVRRLNPRLRRFSLDYWQPTDAAGVARLYRQDRNDGFVPYVATIELQQIVPEPDAP